MDTDDNKNPDFAAKELKNAIEQQIYATEQQLDSFKKQFYALKSLMKAYFGGEFTNETQYRTELIINMPASEPASKVPLESDSAPASKTPEIPTIKKAKLFREKPFHDKTLDIWVFDRLREADGDGKCYALYTEDNHGFFWLKEVNDPDIWQNIYQNREFAIPCEVVKVVEGEIGTKATCTCIEPGEIEYMSYNRRWKVVKPCSVKITSL